MSATVAIFIICFLVSSILLGVGILFARKKVSAAIEKATTEREDQKIAELDDAITEACAYVGSLSPVSKSTELESSLARLQAALKESELEHQKLEGSIAELRQKADGQQKTRYQLKLRKAELQSFSGQLKASKEALDEAFKQTKQELNETFSQIEALSRQVEFTENQKAALSEINETLQLTSYELSELENLYKQARERYLNLEEQHNELDREFRLLVSKGKTSKDSANNTSV